MKRDQGRGKALGWRVGVRASRPCRNRMEHLEPGLRQAVAQGLLELLARPHRRPKLRPHPRRGLLLPSRQVDYPSHGPRTGWVTLAYTYVSISSHRLDNTLLGPCTNVYFLRSKTWRQMSVNPPKYRATCHDIDFGPMCPHVD